MQRMAWTPGHRRRGNRRGEVDRLARLRVEEGWSSWTASPYRQLSRPTNYTWSGLRDVMGAAAWVAAWILGIAIVVGMGALAITALIHWLFD